METGGFEKLWTVLISFVVVLLILLAAALLIFHDIKSGAVLLFLIAALFIFLVIKNCPGRGAQRQPDHVDRENKSEEETE